MDGDQGQTHVADIGEQPVQGGLADNDALEDGDPAAVVAERQSVEPGGPTLVEMFLDTDLVPGVSAGAGCGVACGEAGGDFLSTLTFWPGADDSRHSRFSS